MRTRPCFLARLLEWRPDGKMPLIAEIKPRTPDGKDLLRGRRPADLAIAYEAAGAACISVVTGRWFGGTSAMLAEVASATGLPILQKDFITTRRALEQALTHGASAVLLTRQLVTREALDGLIDCALALGLTPFVEVESAQEVAELCVDARVIVAVNNKDIRLREATGEGIARGLALAAAARGTGAGAIVSASGIEGPCAAKQLMDAGFDGLLVGTALLRAENLTHSLAQLRAALAEDVRRAEWIAG